MSVQSVTPVLNVSSVGASLAWFEVLGWKRGFSWNDGGMICGLERARSSRLWQCLFGQGGDFCCCDGQGLRGTILPKFAGDDATDGVWMSWWMESPADMDALHAVAVANGMTVTYPPTNEPWGVREFHLRHPDGHMFRVSSGLEAE